ncbi:uncharacterized protein LOC117783197 [Drosophila innubila]|uniref:uncharacterized protein LOC117783197 n=1 Tax=Drosophila innubila TaxID=198719 RepID=UPI00148D3BC2|nr:uncharacterized protein LOC117783197 [Drosophila innubila]
MPNSSKKSELSDLKTPTRVVANSSSSSVNSTPTNSNRRQPRKRRRLEKDHNGQQRRESFDSQLDECNIDDVKEIDRRLRKVARANAITSEDMHKVVRSVVRNEHVLALVTLKAEDELAREKREAEAQVEMQQQRGAIIITETPSVAKLTRAKARELNRTPGISLPPLNDTPVNNEIEALIREDLHSDEEDEEYTFKEDDFHSDEDPNTTASDFDSNPCTPQTPLTANEESPVKFTTDGCFKLPPDKNAEDPRIATRTRSKLCLQQTTIEDLQSEFVPPDVEEPTDVLESDLTAIDVDWMQFLNDFSKPLNTSFLGDDDDPINDPEYVAAEMVPVDAEELRDVNIPKKELTDLVSELFADLLQAGVSLDSIELETPQKFLTNQECMPAVQLPSCPDPIEQVTRQINFDGQSAIATQVTTTDAADTSIATHTGIDSFHPHVMSTPSTLSNVVAVPIADTSLNSTHMDPSCTMISIPSQAIGQQPPELIAVPMPGQPNCYQLAKVMATPPAGTAYLSTQEDHEASMEVSSSAEPYDVNFSCKYLSIRKHIHSEYEQQFESLRNLKPLPLLPATNAVGFTQEQHDLLQQQLRIHTQMLTQTFVQTYSHPLLYSMAKKPKEMLHELYQRSVKDASFNCWNLNGAIELIAKWEHDLSSEEFQEENKTMMKFINKETELTDGNTRQVPRLPPRIMDLMLDSPVFMYPQYLPRIAFQPRTVQFTTYAPSEYQLIAMGLEKYLDAIRSAKKPLRKTADPVRIACKRMAKDLIHGKEYRRIFFKVNELCKMQQYNPVKYYFDHQRAPPVNQILLGFEGGVVPTPRQQYHLLANAWKYYIHKKWDNAKRASRYIKPNPVQASEAASLSFLQFVREAVGEDLLLPDSLGEAATPHGSATGHLSQPPLQSSYNNSTKPAKSGQIKQKRCKVTKQDHSTSLTINVNYVFGGEISPKAHGAGVSVPLLPVAFADNVANINRALHASNECSLLSLPPPVPPLADDAPPAVELCFDPLTQTVLYELDKSAERTENISHHSSTTVASYKKARCSIFKRWIVGSHKRRRRLPLTSQSPSQSPPRSRYHVLRQRLRRKLRTRCKSLITSYGSYLQQQRDLYAHAESVQHYHRRFLALELYTQLLSELNMFCQSKDEVVATKSEVSSPQQQQKRQRNEDAARNRRANRQEEMLRHMLTPDSREERNRKDATFAFNFYDKVEEALLSANRLEECQKFTQLLQTFDPKKDKVSELYLNVEKILLPDHAELAEVFLNFLLPEEAAEVGKFFEYFMITNSSNFINKLNIYFCKQPAQIRKIYACLSELAELPSVSMKKVEAKIFPLLKGNQFLCDWFVQQFPQAKPPKRILPPAEPINLHEVLNNTRGEFVETVNDLIEDVPAQGKPPGCQLKYFNGRIFYGSKIMLPAKLSFRAASIYNEQCNDAPSEDILTCAHGVRALGEKLINAACTVDSDDAAERSEEDDASRALVIDTTTGDEENSSSSLDMCDDVTLRAHAIRLNANYYNSGFNSANTSTPNVGGHHHSQHHPHAKKTAINFGEMSPRRQTAANVSPLSGLSPLPALASTGNASPQPDKRKSPTKKVRSPLSQTQARPRYNVQPMVVIHEPQVRAPAHASPAIECAKRLRTLIDQESGPSEELDTKAGIRIIAQAKQTVAKLEPVDSTEKMDAALTTTTIKMDVEISEDEVEVIQSSSDNTPQHVITTQFDSDEDCKLDVVATLANCTEKNESTTTAPTTAATCSRTVTPPGQSNTTDAWTREEDKVILIEMKMGARDRQHLIKRMGAKLQHRNETELRARHQFLMDFLSKLQGK